MVLLRGINVGGANRVPMADLRSLLVDLGAGNVVTYLQSGQAVVDADPEGLADRVEAALADRFGRTIRVLTRTAAEVDAVVAGNPYPHLVDTPKRLHVVFLERDPDPAEVERVGGTRHGTDEFTVADRALYLAYESLSNDSPAAKAVARLKSTGTQTARNWTTVLTLQKLAHQVS